MKGYVGKILIVDLSTGKMTPEEVHDEIYEKFLSGVGLGAYYLYKNIPKDADPLGRENLLGFDNDGRYHGHSKKPGNPGKEQGWPLTRREGHRKKVGWEGH